MSNQEISSLELMLKANDVRKDIIRMLEHVGTGHAGGAMGMADIFTALYFKILRHDPKKPDWDERDLLILSNGHIVPVQYVCMAHSGYFPLKELMTLRQYGSRLQGHPERTKLPGLETTSGPLGCGLSQGAGMALGFRMNNDDKKRVYVLMGDGELDEGNVWEAAMLVGKYRLTNLIGIVDRNNIQIDGTTDDVMPLSDLKGKFEMFGWQVLEIDGNDMQQVVSSLETARTATGKPTMIIAHTVPGKGADFMENDYTWHGAQPNAEQAKEALKQLNAHAATLKEEAGEAT